MRCGAVAVRWRCGAWRCGAVARGAVAAAVEERDGLVAARP
ncbi:hypothetical protein [Lentzea guizhouensis]|nr:hypothetical protein [Lentzea guizhouensis]